MSRNSTSTGDSSPAPETPDAPPPGGNIPEYTVSEISAALKLTVESAFARIRVRGEISGFKRAASGHLYFSLKDENAVLDAVCWKGVAGRLSLAPEDGMEVICEGRLSTFAGRSRYQIVVEALELAGEGALLKLLEERKRRLEAEGLFDPARKKAIPFLPEVIGVVTSPTGAVIRDILHRLADRFPRRVLLWPVLVQGESAPQEIAAAIEGFNRMPENLPRPDLIIVARGGGSLEDLMAFNEEAVVRATAASVIPLISAVGHETDFTLIDFAADLRAPTPTAAAEMAVPVRAELLAGVLDFTRRMVASMDRMIGERRTRVEGLGRGLPEPSRLLEQATQRLDERAERLTLAAANLLARRRADLERLVAGLRAKALCDDIARRRDVLSGLDKALGAGLRRALEDASSRLGHLGRLLESCSYRNVLRRGYAVVRDAGERPVVSAAAATPGLDVSIEFHDGRRPAAIADGGRRPPGPARKPAAQRKKAGKKAGGGDDPQGTLL